MSSGAPDASQGVDASPPDASTSRCDLAKPFGAPTQVPGIDTADDEEGGSLSPDELTIYFASNRSHPGTADFDIFVAARSHPDDPFGTATELATVSSGSDDRVPSISSDGLSLFFHSSRTAGDSYDLFVSTRANTGDSFDPPAALGAQINTTVVETAPAVSADGQSPCIGSAGRRRRP